MVGVRRRSIGIGWRFRLRGRSLVGMGGLEGGQTGARTGPAGLVGNGTMRSGFKMDRKGSGQGAMTAK